MEGPLSDSQSPDAPPPAALAEREPARSFQFERDTFAFANELIWVYRFDPVTGRMTTTRSEPPPTYSHRCFVVVRAARQFFYHAQFDPAAPSADAPTYSALIREVVRRNPRRASAPAERVVIPGYDGLRSFSRAHERLLKAECGSAWASYFLRSHWRMVFPVRRAQQERTARQLQRALRERVAPIVHLFRFPRITINHGTILFGAAESDGEIRFEAYDPNIPEHPVSLRYNRTTRTFHFPRASYWPGGPLQVIEIFCGWFY
jgi:hypothetical protein